MTNAQISKTWEANLLPYVKIVEKGIKNTKKRIASFNNWVEVLVERGNITSENAKLSKYIGKEI